MIYTHLRPSGVEIVDLLRLLQYLVLGNTGEVAGGFCTRMLASRILCMGLPPCGWGQFFKLEGSSFLKLPFKHALQDVPDAAALATSSRMVTCSFQIRLSFLLVLFLWMKNEGAKS